MTLSLYFKNLGPISEAKLNFGEFTLIVGDNGLGKTLLLEAYALYINMMKEKLSHFIKLRYINNLNIKFESDFEDALSMKSDDNIVCSLNFEVKADEALTAIKQEYKNEYLTLLRENLLGSKDCNPEVEIGYSDFNIEKIPNQLRFSLQQRGDLTYLISLNMVGGMRVLRLPNFDMHENKEEAVVEYLQFRLEAILNEVCFREVFCIENLMFFPSERNLYKTNAYKKSADFLEESFSQIHKDSDMRYSESLFVKNYFEYLDFFTYTDANDVFEGRVELYNLLCGALGGIPKFVEGNITSIKNDRAEISQKLFSTKQSRLLPYFMLCSPLLIQVDRIIIEEPESHMSLKSMFEFAEITKYILKNENKKIVMTSHSDVFVTLLNNLLKTSAIEAKVYELIPGEVGSVLKEVECGVYGYELSFMSEQIMRLNTETLATFEDESERDG